MGALGSNNGGSVKEGEDDEDGGSLEIDSLVNPSNPAAEMASNAERPSPRRTSRSVNDGGRTLKKNKRISREISGSLSTSSCSLPSQQKGVRVTSKRRNPKVIIGYGRRGGSDVDALALPLGMSIAAVVAQVLDRKDAAAQRLSADHISMICTSAVKESLANVFGDQFDCFIRNFDKSFGSTLRTLRLINEASLNKGRDSIHQFSTDSCSSEVNSSTYLNRGRCRLRSSFMKDCHSEMPGTPEHFCADEEIRENIRSDCMTQELTLHGQVPQQLACASPITLASTNNHSMMSTIEKSVIEQARSNDLKAFEIGLTMKKLQLRESQLALNSASNCLERFKLSMGISKASFKVEKFKTQLEDTRHAELVKKCIDCLVGGLLTMSASLVYAAYVYSYKRITEATTSCTSSPKESNSWWTPKSVASFNSGLHTLKCQVQVVSRMLFGVLVILAVAYLLLQRSSVSGPTMPVTFILLLLGVFCGFAGKLCVDTLGGNGYHWLLFWETLCLLHFFANAFPSALFHILHGPVFKSQGIEGRALFPYWIRRVIFYAALLLVVPILCGLMPFAGPRDWNNHFFSLVANSSFANYYGD